MIVAITGIILILFVIGHLLGNLQIFIGPDWINGYSQHLRDLGPLLWMIRIFLLLTVVVHIYVTIQLAIQNRRARPEPYIDKEHVKATFASRHMVMSGLIVLAFIIYHLAHFTVRVTDPRFGLLKADPLNRYDVYSMMVYGFQNYYVSGFYVLGLWLLTLHLSHGSSSFFYYSTVLPTASVVIGTGHVHGRDGTGHVRDMSKKFSNVRDIGTLKKP